MLKDISNFNEINDYLGIFNGSLLADIVIIFLLYYTNIFGNPTTLKTWYERYRLSAVLADVFILIIGVILGRYFYYKIFKEYSFIKFTLLILVIQIIHDVLFYFLLIKNLPRGTNNMIDLFKDYANQVNAGAIKGDSFMMIITVIFSAFFANLNNNQNIIIGVFLIYILPYILHIK